MRECMQAEGLSSLDDEVNMLSDQDGGLVRALGLAYNMAVRHSERARRGAIALWHCAAAPPR